ncbi:hypothetical protein [Arcanobacterium haemolyticum]|nr:hypothetical protein [Arcanobacterium haemolyticum]
MWAISGFADEISHDLTEQISLLTSLHISLSSGARGVRSWI